MFVCLLLLLLLPVLPVLLLREWLLPLLPFIFIVVDDDDDWSSSSPLPPSLIESETDGTLVLSIVADVDVDVDVEPTTRRSAARFIVSFGCLGVLGVCLFGCLALCVGKWCTVYRTSM